MVGAFYNNVTLVTFVTCHGSVCFKNIGLEGSLSTEEGVLYLHCLPYTDMLSEITAEFVVIFYLPYK